MSLISDALADTVRDSVESAEATREDWERAIDQVFDTEDDTATPVEPGKYGWIDFDHMENDDDPERYYIEIFSTNDRGQYEDEVAVICHRTVGGKYPLDGEVANAKRENAQKIVDALNAVR